MEAEVNEWSSDHDALQSALIRALLVKSRRDVVAVTGESPITDSGGDNHADIGDIMFLGAVVQPVIFDGLYGALRTAKGNEARRKPTGVYHGGGGSNRLTNRDEIRAACAVDGVTRKDVARRFNIDVMTVYRILREVKAT